MKKFEALKEKVQRTLNNSHPAVANCIRAALLSVGSLVIIVGLILVPLPGPGWLIVFFGVSIIALISSKTELLLNKTVKTIKRIYENLKNRFNKKKPVFVSDETVHISILR